MYACGCCKGIFDEPEIYHWREPREFWGATVYETMSEERCPFCNSGEVYEYDEDEEEEEDV